MNRANIAFGIWSVMGILAIILFFVMVSTNETKTIAVGQLSSNEVGRINVASSQTIMDASWRKRDVLVLRDTITGTEYIAVMGAGVSQICTNGKVIWEE